VIDIRLLSEGDAAMLGRVADHVFDHPVDEALAAELWVNEVGVAVEARRRGVGQALMNCLFELGRELGCSEAWVLTERSDEAAEALYRSVGGLEDAGKTVSFSFQLRDLEA